MDIFACQRKAERDGSFDTATFTLSGPNGSFKCKWLDAYFGLFQVEGKEGFLMAGDCEGRPLVVTDYASNQVSTESIL